MKRAVSKAEDEQQQERVAYLKLHKAVAVKYSRSSKYSLRGRGDPQ
ncbi:hypothetical protein [Pontibacter korlensis]|nr:hypothetical protein [Pontibacter korlensis]